MSENTTNQKTDVEFINEMADLILQMDAINDSLKDVKSQAKEAGFDAALLGTVAKAVAAAKQTELTEKSEALIELLQKVK